MFRILETGAGTLQVARVDQDKAVEYSSIGKRSDGFTKRRPNGTTLINTSINMDRRCLPGRRSRAAFQLAATQ